MFPKAPALSFEDLGIDLEEDSEDLTEQEVETAIDTDNAGDFSAKVMGFIDDNHGRGVPIHELRRRAGILFSRTRFEEGPSLVLRIEWLRKGL